jgi:hypothetical protein
MPLLSFAPMPPSDLHDTLTPTSAIDDMINRAKLLAGTNPHFFSHATVAAPTNVEKVTVLLRADTDPAVRVRALTNKELVTQFLFCQDGMILPFTSPIVGTTATNVPIMLGSMSDLIDTTIPVSIGMQLHESWVTTLLPEADIALFNLPRLAEQPDLVAGPSATDGTPGADPSLARLGFGDDAAAINPKFAALPVMLPLPAGVHIPIGNWLITEHNPEFAAAFPLGEVWRKGLAYLIAHNTSFSVNSSVSTMFDHTVFTANQFAMPLAESAFTAFTMIPPTSPQYAHMMAVMNGAYRAAWLRKSATLLPTPVARTVFDVDSVETTQHGMGAGGNVGSPWTTAEGMANLLAETMRATAGHTTTTLSERDHKKAAADAAIKYSLCFARLAPSADGHGPVEVIPAVIRPEFKEMLETTKTSQATSLMRELLETHTRRAAGSPLFLKASVTLTGDWVDGVITACLRDFRLIDKTLAVAPANVKIHLGPVTCVTPTATSVVLQQRRDADQRLLIQEAVGEAPAKMDKKSTELFVGGSYHSAVAATNAFANWHLLCEIISPEYGQSEMKKTLDNWVTNFHGPMGREWAQRYSSYHQLTLNLVADMSDIVAQFVSIAKDPTNRLAIADQTSPIHPRFYEEATLFAATLQMDLFHAITRGLGKGYIDMPFVAKQLPFFATIPLRLAEVGGPGAGPARQANHRAPAPAAPYQQQGRGGGGPNVERRAPNQQRDGGQQARGAAPAGGGGREAGRGLDEAARDANKRQGFLVYDPLAAGANGRLPPPCDVFVKLRNMTTAERLCLNFCTRGFFCGRGSNCQQVHVTTFGALPTVSQEPVRSFVERTNGLSFAPGQNPPTGTP